MAQLASRGPFTHSAPAVLHVPPPGAFAPGTKVQVGSHRVIIEKYLSEGGFAHVYVVRLPRPVDGNELAVLKRVAVPDKEHLANMRTEVDTMKRLRGHNRIVKYYDSHASQLKGGGYEVFLLMEYCAGGGLIDFMNTRLQQRLTEPEILKIFSDVAEGVACMHYLKPPLLHRDLKVENVLISVSGAARTYKVCDFGSAAPPRPAATTAAEGRLIEDDVQRHTTLQYRSPEMIDVYRKQPINEKADIWALGVLLYKLCYYTTPFEEVGQMAILNASFKYPAYPPFSDRLKLLIASMLKEHPSKRPNIYQVVKEVCQMRGKDVPIKDIYVQRSQSERRRTQELPPNPSSSQSTTGASLLSPTKQLAPVIPDIAPMRRGRPEKPVSHHGSAKPSPSPLRMIEGSDPFASLDGGKALPGDELSSRFPTLDQFSLLTDSGKKFEFDPSSSKKLDNKGAELSVRVTNALADEAFTRPAEAPKTRPVQENTPSLVVPRTSIERKKSLDTRDVQVQTPAPASQPVPVPKKTSMVSTGTMTSSSPTTSSLSSSTKSSLNRPIYNATVPEGSSRGILPPRVPEKTRFSTVAVSSGSRLANLLRDDASKSQSIVTEEPKSPTSSRPSLEGGRPSMKDLDVGLSRSRSLNLTSRPMTVNMGSRPTHIQDQSIKRTDYGSAFTSAEPDDMPALTTVESDTNIKSDVDYLRAREEEEKNRKHHHKRLSSGSKPAKRSSLSSISLAGTKNLLAGRFGDAFRKFESNHNDHPIPRSRSPSPSRDPINVLTPIAGSEATDLSDDRHGFDETEDLSPEVRRELEKRRLEAEERRVAAAAAEYRRRLAEKGSTAGRDGGKATSIQNKVHSLLKENDKPATKTAAGYGRFTDAPSALQARPFEGHAPQHSSTIPAPPPSSSVSTSRELKHLSASAPASAVNLVAVDASARSSQRPAAPPKPMVLRTGTGRSNGPLRVEDNSAANGSVEATGPGDDWETNFNKRYPSLSGLEMVEREIDAPSSAPLRTREV